MKSLIQLIACTAFVSALLSCGTNQSQNLSRPQATAALRADDQALPLVTLTWETGGSDIIKRNCASCHKSFATIEAVRSDREIMLQTINDGSMPKRKAPKWDEDKAILVDYLTNGADLK